VFKRSKDGGASLVTEKQPLTQPAGV
jgi:hypothetical protein